ncbi:glycosyltransferase family 2 protein [Methylobacterium sp. P31]
MGRWGRAAALALRTPQAWRFLAASVLSAAGKRLRPAMPAPSPRTEVRRMRMCICICTCERPAGLARLLKALDQQRLGDLAETALRILIVDNGRSRAAVPVVEAYRATGRFPVTYTREETRGLAAVRNRSLEAAAAVGADWIALIDDDEFPDRDWLHNLLGTALRSGVAACVGPVVPFFDRVPPAWAVAGASSPSAWTSATASWPMATPATRSWTCG